MLSIDEDKSVAKSLKLRGNVKKGIWWGVVVGLIQMGYVSVADWLWGDGTVDFSLTASGFVNAVLLVGLVEEIPFRGFLLPKIRSRTTFVKANLITALLFFPRHFPGWIFSEEGVRLSTSLSVFALGYLFGWLVHKTDSLGASIIFHSINNLSSLVIYSL